MNTRRTNLGYRGYAGNVRELRQANRRRGGNAPARLRRWMPLIDWTALLGNGGTRWSRS